MSQEIWLAPASVVVQERGPEWLDIVDDKPWSSASGFHRGFCSSFRLRPDRQIWFHFPFQVPVGYVVDRASFLWETDEGASLTWACVHHGGLDRQHLSEPGAAITGMSEPFDPPEQWRQFYPDHARVRTDLAVTPIAVRFGIQLCILADGPGVVRFYGAGLRIITE
ncbi:hypothetical protein [Sphingobium sp.]|uniref:hypothetical protein n=1 Tax=Sphingobium sp. TaxID=1912891 RepID=UPI0026184DFE|nr:hypothetical protein [Sphingobium sp.]